MADPPLRGTGTQLGGTPVRSELVYLLVLLDKEVTEQQPSEAWEHVLRPPAGRALHSRRFVAAQRVSSLRLDSCSLRSTFDACDSTVFTEMNSREPISR